MRRILRDLTFVVLTGLLSVAGARAQEMTPEMMAKWQEVASPGERHAMLNDLVGNWTQKVTMWMAPGAPPLETASTSSAEMSLDGRWLVEYYDGDMMGMPFHGVNWLGYDNYRGEYVAIWMDNMSTAPMISRGSYDPATKAITMRGTTDDFMNDKRDVPYRTVTRPGEGGAMVYEMYMPGPDGQEFLTMRVESYKQPE